MVRHSQTANPRIMLVVNLWALSSFSRRCKPVKSKKLKGKGKIPGPHITSHHLLWQTQVGILSEPRPPLAVKLPPASTVPHTCAESPFPKHACYIKNYFLSSMKILGANKEHAKHPCLWQKAKGHSLVINQHNTSIARIEKKKDTMDLPVLDFLLV